MSILDVVILRGKRKDVKVANIEFFTPGIKVEFLRANESPNEGFGLIGKATIEMIDRKYEIVKFDALPKDLKIGDLIQIPSDLEPEVRTMQLLDWSV
jgi:hypothetical protein